MSADLSVISSEFTEDTLDAIIRECGGIRHTSWRFGEGFKKGDFYVSDAFRLLVQGVTENGSPIEVKMVIKAMPQNIGRCKTFRSADFFRNEANFYKHVLPAMREFQQKRGILGTQQTAFTEFPRCLFAHIDGTNDFIAMEDLCPDGFVSPPRQEGIDFEHCRLILQTLGKYHALSLAIGDQEPELLAKMIGSLEEIYYADQFRSWHAPFVKLQIQVATDAVTKELGGTEYERKMLEFTNHEFYDRMIRMTHRHTKFSVIGHGDCWLPNFLMRYEDGKPVVAKMIDFQLARFASPALDIAFLIYSCTVQSMREQHYDELIRIYHQSASDLLIALGSDPTVVFPWSGLQAELKESARFGLGTGMEAVPLSMQDDDELSDLNILESDVAVPLSDIWKISLIKSQPKRQRLADIFKHATDMGYLE